MAESISIVLTCVCSFLLYVVLLHKVKEHHKYVIGLPSVDSIQTKLQKGFRGFVFCLDVIGYPNTQKWVEPLKQIIEQQGLELLVFDGHIIFSDRMEIAHMLKVKTHPCVVAVNMDDNYAEQMVVYQIHINQNMTDIKQFITNKLSVIKS